MLSAVMQWIGSYVSYFPLVIFISLMLGGCNLPISEDVLVIMSAVLCKQEHASIPAFYCALYFGAVLSDMLVYFWGTLLRRGTVSFLFTEKLLKKDNTVLIADELQRHGFLTFLVGRFVPFGVRNILFMTAGFLHFPFHKFVIFDSIAAFCNISTLFWLVYFLGARGSAMMKTLGVIFFILFIGICIFIIRSAKKATARSNKISK